MLNIGQKRRKLPWHEYLFVVVAGFVGIQISDWLSGQITDWLGGVGILLMVVAALAGGFAAGHLARYLALWLGGGGGRFPALKSKHVGYFDR